MFSEAVNEYINKITKMNFIEMKEKCIGALKNKKDIIDGDQMLTQTIKVAQNDAEES